MKVPSLDGQPSHSPEALAAPGDHSALGESNHHSAWLFVLNAELGVDFNRSAVFKLNDGSDAWVWLQSTAFQTHCLPRPYSLLAGAETHA
ncbi:unnamed protein product [Dibothriocephalus latus]|uniref:Uncharacterized protein n=1 Tax=Dibothriocephalus latus TaxID=60516 RepID=A0A3P7N1U2_DIBLA|nr:unnamed protein product [Dibothriocephalus latus]